MYRRAFAVLLVVAALAAAPFGSAFHGTARDGGPAQDTAAVSNATAGGEAAVLRADGVDRRDSRNNLRVARDAILLLAVLVAVFNVAPATARFAVRRTRPRVRRAWSSSLGRRAPPSFQLTTP